MTARKIGKYLGILSLALAGGVHAQEADKGPQAATATFVYVSRESAEDPRTSLSEPVAADFGWLGAKFGASELNVQGRFLNAHFELTKVTIGAGEALSARIRSALGGRPALIVADLQAADLLALADLPEVASSTIIDARTSDDALRQDRCRGNVFHVLPSWDMRAYALSHFLIGRGWRNWLLLSGATDDDRNYAAALRRAAQVGGARVVRQAALPVSAADASLTQSQVDARIQELTRASIAYDIVLVADSQGTIGERVMFNTSASRLVAGTQGLRATAWDPQFRDFAARGFGFRFTQAAAREMSERDYGNWLAVTVLGEAVLRGQVTDSPGVSSYLLSNRFSVAALKGQPLTFRREDQQLRQPILLFGPKVLVELTPSEQTPAAAGDANATGRQEEPCRRRKIAMN